MYAIGDVHGDLQAFKTALVLAGAVDSAGTWIGGDTIVVQVCMLWGVAIAEWMLGVVFCSCY